jgi:ketosteroid isomerase-like protein
VTSAQNEKDTVRRLIERDWSAATQGDADVLHQYFSDDYVNHTPVHHDHEAAGVEGLKSEAGHVGASASDLQMRVDMLVGEDDIVIAHWSSSSRRTGRRGYKHIGSVEPHGRDLSLSGVAVFRMRDGKIVEGWSYDNHLDTLAEHGVLVAAY